MVISFQGGFFAETECLQVRGDPLITFLAFLFVHSFAGLFTLCALTLLIAAAVIATNETSVGRGDVGRQLSFGFLGFAVFAPLAGYLAVNERQIPHLLSIEEYMPVLPVYWTPFMLHSLCMFISALIALSASDMPLNRPDSWWNTRSGMVALPMTAVKGYNYETMVLMVLFIVLGTFWSSINSYLPL